MLRSPTVDETPALVAIGVSTGLFQPQEADALLKDVLDQYHAGTLGERHRILVWADDAPAGWAYVSPDERADGVWELWWIGVSPERQCHGIGRALLEGVETQVALEGGRVLLIATSALPALADTRRFYARRGYDECGRIRDFYAPGDAKVIFAKTLR